MKQTIKNVVWAGLVLYFFYSLYKGEIGWGNVFAGFIVFQLLCLYRRWKNHKGVPFLCRFGLHDLLHMDEKTDTMVAREDWCVREGCQWKHRFERHSIQSVPLVFCRWNGTNAGPGCYNIGACGCQVGPGPDLRKDES